MDAVKIKTTAHKALIATNPHYHAWSVEQQERFRATISEVVESRIEAVLLKGILNIQCAAKNAGEFWRDLPLAKLNNLNWAKLFYAVFDDDMMYLNK